MTVYSYSFVNVDNIMYCQNVLLLLFIFSGFYIVVLVIVFTVALRLEVDVYSCSTCSFIILLLSSFYYCPYIFYIWIAIGNNIILIIILIIPFEVDFSIFSLVIYLLIYLLIYFSFWFLHVVSSPFAYYIV